MTINFPHHKSKSRVYQKNICKSLLKIKSIISARDKFSTNEDANILEIKNILKHRIDSSNLVNYFSNTNINNKPTIRVVYHVPFEKESLPGNLYMPKLEEKHIIRAELLTFIASQINKLENKSIIVLITTQEFYNTLQNFIDGKTEDIFIPVFLKEKTPHIMLSRQFMYYTIQELLRSFFPPNYPIIYQDSDLIPIKPSIALIELSSSLNCPIFCVRSAPNLFPVNGGFYIIPIGLYKNNALRSIVSNYWEINKIPKVSQILQTDIKCWDGDQLALADYINFKDTPGLSYIKNNVIFLASVDSINMPINSLKSCNPKKFKSYNIHIKGKAKENTSYQELQYQLN